MSTIFNTVPLTRAQLREKYPLTYPTLESWQTHVAGRTTKEQLSHDAHVLSTGGGLRPVHHDFSYTPDYDLAWQALFERARLVGATWCKTRKRFIDV